jgi:Xaa-Pro dipeptidase
VIDKSVEHTRFGAVLKLLRQRELGGLVVYSNGVCDILRPSFLRYVAGFGPMGPNNAAIISSSGEVVLVVEPAWDSRRAKRQSWIEDVRGTQDFPESLSTILQSLGIQNSVGLSGGSQMPRSAYAAIEQHCRVSVADDLLESIARTKSLEEIELVRKTSRSADVGLEAFCKSARVGVSEFELVAEVEYAMRCAGADDVFILLSSAPHNTAMRAPTDHCLSAGDIVIAEISPVCRGQFTQLCRTIVVGQPSAVLVEKYQLLVKAFEKAMSAMRANVPASIIASTIDDVLTEAGYGPYCKPPYMRTRGHGFGVGSVAPGGIIDAGTTQPLIEHQVIMIQPNQFIPETGYLACGETVLVLASGVERLSQSEAKLYVSEN